MVEGEEEKVQTPEELKAEIAALTEQVSKLTPEAEAKKQTQEELESTKKMLRDSEERRRQQTQNFKKLRDMTDAEKKEMSTRDLEILERQERLEQEQESLKKDKRDTSIKNSLDKYVGTNKDLRDKVENEAKELGLEGKANSDEIETIIKKAAKIHGIGQGPDPLREAHSFQGRGPVEMDNQGNSFADTGRGKTIASLLGWGDIEKK